MTSDTRTTQQPGGAASPSPEDPWLRPGWQLVRDLPAPPEVAQAIEEYCQRMGFRRGRWRRWAEDVIKLQYHYGGKIAAVMETPRGLVVVAAGESLDSEPIASFRASLTPEQSSLTALHFLSPWNDETSFLGRADCP